MDDWVEESGVAAAEEVIRTLSARKQVLLDDILIAFFFDLVLEEDKIVVIVALVVQMGGKLAGVFEISGNVLIQGLRRALVACVDLVGVLDVLRFCAKGINGQEVVDDVVWERLASAIILYGAIEEVKAGRVE